MLCVAVFALRGEVTVFALRGEVTVGTGAEGRQEKGRGVRVRVVALEVGFQEESGVPWRDCKVWVSAVRCSVPCVAIGVAACRFVVCVCGRRALQLYSVCECIGICLFTLVQGRCVVCGWLWCSVQVSEEAVAVGSCCVRCAACAGLGDGLSESCVFRLGSGRIFARKSG